MAFEHPISVRFADTDMQGHVFFANYLTFCDEAMTAYLRHLGVPWQTLVEGGADMFYVKATCEYRGSATFEDALRVETAITRIGETSFTTRFSVRDPSGQVIAEAETVSVCVDPETRSKTRVPDRLRDAVAAHSA